MRRAACFALAACVAFGACGASSACAHDKPGTVAPADLARWIANDEAALRRTRRTSSSAYGTHLASLLNGLWPAHRDHELAQRLSAMKARVAGASDERADARFFDGDYRAAFDAYAVRGTALREARALARAGRWLDVVRSMRGVRESAQPDGRSIDAALLEGDAYAACGRYDAARTTWYRAFSTAVLQPRDHYRFFPEWTSAMRRLVRYRARADRPAPAPACRALPRPIIDPVS